jgi:hypothetical protein
LTLTSRLILATSLFLTTGACDRFRTPEINAQPEVAEADLRAFFCDQTELFRWTDEEWVQRVEEFPANLRREIQINERRRTWECPNG